LTSEKVGVGMVSHLPQQVLTPPKLKDFAFLEKIILRE
jgi:hypothetical protein